VRRGSYTSKKRGKGIGGGKPKPRLPCPTAPAGTAWIPLTQGKFALVDAADYERLACYSWQARSCRHPGGEKWYAKRDRYWGDRSAGQPLTIHMHQEVLGLDRQGLRVDHINGDGLDNRRANLRVATQSQNLQNAKRRANRSGFKGVQRSRVRWVARIKVAGRSQHLGCFDLVEDAARAYNRAALEHFGQFARINEGLGDGPPQGEKAK